MTAEAKGAQINIEDEMKASYLDYAMSVIVGRALPDARDGLKPVHRRILYAMYREGLLSNRRYSKSAGVVGEVIKRYHPHGDAAVYDALVRMVQDFNMRYPMVDGQGNFGSMDGDPPAAYRYTEVRLSKLAEEMLADIDMETVDFVSNFDDSANEPVVLPTRIPNLLVNGSSGIAVGMATNIPPHNLAEVINGLNFLLENHEATIDELIRIIKGPDFPTAGYICGLSGIEEAYRTGRGIIQMRAKAIIESNPRTDRESIIITELPYQVNKARLIEKIAELIRDRRVEGISDLRDESDREGMRIVLELKKGEIASARLNQLYKHTQMQSTFGVIMLALINNQPKVLNLKEILQAFIDHRRDVVVRRTRFELRKAEEKAHILEGLKIALDHLDEIIALIKRSRSPDEARDALMRGYELSQVQAQAILDMKLQRLTALEREKLIQDYQETIQRIEYLRSLLASEAAIRGVIKNEFLEVKEQYQDARRTEIIPEVAEISIEDMIAPEDMAITISHTGYIKRNPVTLYRSQGRGGKGKIAMETKEEDFVEHLFVASTRDLLLFFTDTGKVYWLKVYQIPEAGRLAKGKAIVNLLQLPSGQKIAAVLPVARFEDSKYILMATERGIIKKTELKAYENPRVGGIIAINVDEGDRLIAARITDGNREILMATKKGLAIRFPESQAREMGRVARGVKGVELEEGDKVIGMEVLRDNSTILTITEKGFGKRTDLSEYRLQRRGGKGVITIKANQRNGDVVALFQVADDDELMMITAEGKLIRLKVNTIRVIGRNTQGVRLFNIGESDKVVDMAILAEKEEADQV